MSEETLANGAGTTQSATAQAVVPGDRGGIIGWIREHKDQILVSVIAASIAIVLPPLLSQLPKVPKVLFNWMGLATVDDLLALERPVCSKESELSHNPDGSFAYRSRAGLSFEAPTGMLIFFYASGKRDVAAVTEADRYAKVEARILVDGKLRTRDQSGLVQARQAELASAASTVVGLGEGEHTIEGLGVFQGIRQRGAVQPSVELCYLLLPNGPVGGR